MIYGAKHLNIPDFQLDLKRILSFKDKVKYVYSKDLPPAIRIRIWYAGGVKRIGPTPTSVAQQRIRSNPTPRTRVRIPVRSQLFSAPITPKSSPTPDPTFLQRCSCF